MVQLSWNQPLVTSLRVAGSAEELVLDPRRIDALPAGMAASLASLRFVAIGLDEAA